MMITSDLAQALLEAEARVYKSRLERLKNLDGNPLRIETAEFRGATGLSSRVIRDTPFNRVLCTSDQIAGNVANALSWQKEHGSTPCFEVCPYASSDELLRELSSLNLCQSKFTTTLAREIVQISAEVPSSNGVVVHDVTNNESEFDVFVATALKAYSWPDFVRPNLIAQFSQPGWSAYYATVDGKPAAVATMYIADNVASLVTAITIESFRRRGCQSALIRARMADAYSAGAALVTVQTEPGSPSQRNMHRAGLEVAFNKAIWTERPL